MSKNGFFLGFALSALVVGRPALLSAQPLPGLADKTYKEGVLRKVADIVESKYVLAERAKAYADEFRAKCASGTYDALTDPKDFADKVTADLIAITHDKHLNFQWIEPGIGYIDLRRFYSFDQAKDMAVAAMTFLSNARAIIIDVRENGGGSGDYLSSYFLPYPTQLSGSYARQTGKLTEGWTRRDIGTEPRLDVPLFILTGPNTFSASESFAYDMQTLKRARLVGEPTKGGAHSTDVFGIDDRFEFYISTERGVSPVTGGNWEEGGVIPDLRVPAAAALDAALVEARQAAEAFGKAKDAGLKTAVDEMQILADGAARLYREGKDREAAAALDALVAKARAAGLASEFFMWVFAYNFQAPGDERMLLAVLEKNVELFPGSYTAFEILASVCASQGKTKLALGYFRKVLELDPGNRNAAKAIKELRK